MRMYPKADESLKEAKDKDYPVGIEIGKFITMSLTGTDYPPFYQGTFKIQDNPDAKYAYKQYSGIGKSDKADTPEKAESIAVKHFKEKFGKEPDFIRHSYK